MSFSSDLRAELARISSPGRQAGETELAVLLRNLCRISAAPEGGTTLTFHGGNESALKKCFTLILKNVNISSDFCCPTGTGAEEERGDPPVLVLPARFTALLQKLQLAGEDGTAPENDGTVPSVLTEGKRSRAYLRGMFLCTGFMSDPSQSYQLEFRCISEPQAEQVRSVLAEASIRSGLTRRKRYHVVYVKDSGDIVTLLQLMGASVSLMATENARILKEVRNNVNRRVNCETANIGKTVESAVRQRGDIKLLRESGILESLPAPLREAARLREEHPGASLSELGKLTDPPVGRSGMNHRMRKLSSLAEKVRGGGEPGKL